jgi:hypothetical protein
MKNERLNRRFAGALVGALLVSLAGLAWAPAGFAAGSADGAITGTVVNVTTGDPVPAQEVTLHMLADQAELGTLATRTDRKGTFSFPAPTAGTQAYQLTAAFQGVTYSGAVTPLPLTAATATTLNVYETTTDPSQVTLTNWTIWVDLDGTGAAIQHDLEWRNDGPTAFVGTRTLADGSPVVTELPLARGASDPQYLGAYLDTPGSVDGSSYVNPQPLVPGTTTATLRYTVPTLGDITLPIDFATESVQLFAPATATVSAPGLAPGERFTDHGITYQSWSGVKLQPGSTINVRVSGLEGGRSSLAVLILGTFGAALLAGVALWLVARRRRAHRPRTRKGGQRRAPTKPRAELPPPPRARRARAARSAARVPAGVAGRDGSVVETNGADADADADEQFDLLLDEIAALDLAHERGLLERRSYEGLRASAKRRLLQLGGDLGGEGHSDEREE